METEFDVKIQSGDLYDYLLYHTFTSLSGLIGMVAGALMLVAGFSGGRVICLLAGAVILLYLPCSLFLKSKQQFLANPVFKEPLHYKLTEEGIEISQKEEVQSQKWEDMYKAVSTMRSIIVYTSRVNATIFPKREMGEKSTAVIEIISTHMPPKKVRIRG